MTEQLAHALAEAAEEMSPARLPDDLYRRGRHRHLRRVVAAALAALLLVVSAPLLLWPSGPGREQFADAPDGAVPGVIYQPLPWQAPVQQAPAGRAALLMSGTGEGLGNWDWPGTYGSKIGVVGRDGSYRMLRYATLYQQVARDILLSPDGRYVAGDGSIEDTVGLADHSDEITVVDLVTGRTRRYRVPSGDRVLAWRPGSGALLVHSTAGSNGGDSLRLLDLGTGTYRDVVRLTGAPFDPLLGVAFTPDGRQLAVQDGTAVSIVDLTVDPPQPRPLAGLASTEWLAGTGAFTADGSRFGVLSLEGCATNCSYDALKARRWTLRTRDSRTGAPVEEPAFAGLDGAAVRVAGWQRDGTAVVIRYRAAPDVAPTPGLPSAYRAAVTDVDLLALPSGGAAVPLLRRPSEEIYDLDVARDLILDGRFGGPSPRPGILPLAHWVPILVVMMVGAAVLVYPLTRLVLRIRARRRSLPPLPPNRSALPLRDPSDRNQERPGRPGV